MQVAPLAASERPARGMFLVAEPDLRDPNFARSVVLLIDYGEHGANGVIVNRRTEARLTDLLPEIEEKKGAEGRVFLGGPVSPEGVLVLLRSGEPPEGSQPVFADVYASARRDLLEQLIQGGGTFRVYAGHAGWAPGQLDWEILRGGWALVPADADAVFDEEPNEVWNRMREWATSPLVSMPGSEQRVSICSTAEARRRGMELR